MKIITIRYECGCKARVIKPEATDGKDHIIQQYMLWCIKHTFEVGEAIEAYNKTELLT
jgi:hypothetical protein